MLIAGEASGDLLAAELIEALRSEMRNTNLAATSDYQPLATSLAPRFFGAGGPRMAAAGVDLAYDLTVHSLIGLSGVVRGYLKFRALFRQLLTLTLQRKPDFIICVDFSGFNRRFAHAIKEHIRATGGWFHDWNPRIVQYVSPQVWASRAGRARQMERDYDLLLSIIPFEKDWYANHAPRLRVEFVGNPIVDRYPSAECGPRTAEYRTIVLLPGSRVAELARHLPVMLGAFSVLRASISGLRARIIVPSQALLEQAKRIGVPSDVPIQAGGLPEALAQADLAISKTGTISTECAWFGVPTVTLYKTSWTNYEIGKRIVKVKSLTMPNLLADEQIFPEFIQDAATPDDVARAALELLQNETRRAKVKARLAEIMATLGAPGASRRAAKAILGLT
jgi:lipid-A-disaccharide synthase